MSWRGRLGAGGNRTGVNARRRNFSEPPSMDRVREDSDGSSDEEDVLRVADDAALGAGSPPRTSRLSWENVQGSGESAHELHAQLLVNPASGEEEQVEVKFLVMRKRLLGMKMFILALSAKTLFLIKPDSGRTVKSFFIGDCCLNPDRDGGAFVLTVTSDHGSMSLRYHCETRRSLLREFANLHERMVPPSVPFIYNVKKYKTCVEPRAPGERRSSPPSLSLHITSSRILTVDTDTLSEKPGSQPLLALCRVIILQDSTVTGELIFEFLGGRRQHLRCNSPERLLEVIRISLDHLGEPMPEVVTCASLDDAKAVAQEKEEERGSHLLRLPVMKRSKSSGQYKIRELGLMDNAVVELNSYSAAQRKVYPLSDIVNIAFVGGRAIMLQTSWGENVSYTFRKCLASSALVDGDKCLFGFAPLTGENLEAAVYQDEASPPPCGYRSLRLSAAQARSLFVSNVRHCCQACNIWHSGLYMLRSIPTHARVGDLADPVNSLYLEVLLRKIGNLHSDLITLGGQVEINLSDRTLLFGLLFELNASVRPREMASPNVNADRSVLREAASVALHLITPSALQQLSVSEKVTVLQALERLMAKEYEEAARHEHKSSIDGLFLCLGSSNGAVSQAAALVIEAVLIPIIPSQGQRRLNPNTLKALLGGKGAFADARLRQILNRALRGSSTHGDSNSDESDQEESIVHHVDIENGSMETSLPAPSADVDASTRAAMMRIVYFILEGGDKAAERRIVQAVLESMDMLSTSRALLTCIRSPFFELVEAAMELLVANMNRSGPRESLQLRARAHCILPWSLLLAVAGGRHCLSQIAVKFCMALCQGSPRNIAVVLKSFPAGLLVDHRPEELFDEYGAPLRDVTGLDFAQETESIFKGFSHAVSQNVHRPDLVWNQKCRVELMRRIKWQVQGLEAQQARGTSRQVQWNESAWDVPWHLLSDSCKVGRFHLEHLMEACHSDDDLWFHQQLLEDPIPLCRFFDRCHMRLLQEENQPVLELILTTLTSVLRKLGPSSIPVLPFLPSIVRLVTRTFPTLLGDLPRGERTYTLGCEFIRCALEGNGGNVNIFVSHRGPQDISSLLHQAFLCGGSGAEVQWRVPVRPVVLECLLCLNVATSRQERLCASEIQSLPDMPVFSPYSGMEGPLSWGRSVPHPPHAASLAIAESVDIFTDLLLAHDDMEILGLSLTLLRDACRGEMTGMTSSGRQRLVVLCLKHACLGRHPLLCAQVLAGEAVSAPLPPPKFGGKLEDSQSSLLACSPLYPLIPGALVRVLLVEGPASFVKALLAQDSGVISSPTLAWTPICLRMLTSVLQNDVDATSNESIGRSSVTMMKLQSVYASQGGIPKGYVVPYYLPRLLQGDCDMREGPVFVAECAQCLSSYAQQPPNLPKLQVNSEVKTYSEVADLSQCLLLCLQKHARSRRKTLLVALQLVVNPILQALTKLTRVLADGQVSDKDGKVKALVGTDIEAVERATSSLSESLHIAVESLGEMGQISVYCLGPSGVLVVPPEVMCTVVDALTRAALRKAAIQGRENAYTPYLEHVVHSTNAILRSELHRRSMYMEENGGDDVGSMGYDSQPVSITGLDSLICATLKALMAFPQESSLGLAIMHGISLANEGFGGGSLSHSLYEYSAHAFLLMQCLRGNPDETIDAVQDVDLAAARALHVMCRQDHQPTQASLKALLTPGVVATLRASPERFLHLVRQPEVQTPVVLWNRQMRSQVLQLLDLAPKPEVLKGFSFGSIAPELCVNGVYIRALLREATTEKLHLGRIIPSQYKQVDWELPQGFLMDVYDALLQLVQNLPYQSVCIGDIACLLKAFLGLLVADDKVGEFLRSQRGDSLGSLFELLPPTCPPDILGQDSAGIYLTVLQLAYIFASHSRTGSETMVSSGAAGPLLHLASHHIGLGSTYDGSLSDSILHVILELAGVNSGVTEPSKRFVRHLVSAGGAPFFISRFSCGGLAASTRLLCGRILYQILGREDKEYTVASECACKFVPNKLVEHIAADPTASYPLQLIDSSIRSPVLFWDTSCRDRLCSIGINLWEQMTMPYTNVPCSRLWMDKYMGPDVQVPVPEYARNEPIVGGLYYEEFQRERGYALHKEDPDLIKMFFTTCNKKFKEGSVEVHNCACLLEAMYYCMVPLLPKVLAEHSADAIGLWGSLPDMMLRESEGEDADMEGATLWGARIACLFLSLKSQSPHSLLCASHALRSAETSAKLFGSPKLGDLPIQLLLAIARAVVVSRESEAITTTKESLASAGVLSALVQRMLRKGEQAQEGGNPPTRAAQELAESLAAKLLACLGEHAEAGPTVRAYLKDNGHDNIIRVTESIRLGANEDRDDLLSLLPPVHPTLTSHPLYMHRASALTAASEEPSVPAMLTMLPCIRGACPGDAPAEPYKLQAVDPWSGLSCLTPAKKTTKGQSMGLLDLRNSSEKRKVKLSSVINSSVTSPRLLELFPEEQKRGDRGPRSPTGKGKDKKPALQAKSFRAGPKEVTHPHRRITSGKRL